MFLPGNSELNIASLSSIFSDMSESYKIYWFRSIMDGVEHGNRVMTFDDIINRMIVNAWYPVSEYHLNLGPADTLEKTVHYVHTVSGLQTSAAEKDILSFLHASADPQLIKYKNTLATFVPYRLLSPFMPDFKGKAWDNQRNTIDHINQSQGTLYSFAEGKGLGRMVVIREKWMPYLISNQGIIDGWIEFSMIQYLQKRNPSVPGISNKLHAPTERKLDKAKGFWKAVVNAAPIHDIYSSSILTVQDISLDHFVPWSFVAHDELWNLVPTTRSINSSKSNGLPNWDTFFPRLCAIEYESYELIWQNDKVAAEFRKCEREHINSNEARMGLYQPGISQTDFATHLGNLLLPTYQAARNQGFQEWALR